MRSSSVKTLTVAVSLALTLTAATPLVAAAPRKSGKTPQASSSARPEEKGGTFRMIERIMKRVLGVSGQTSVAPPIP